jgi:hypothetical protein
MMCFTDHPQPQQRQQKSLLSEAVLSTTLIENCFCRIKDWRRIATRYDKLARNFLAATTLVGAPLPSAWGWESVACVLVSRNQDCV